MQNQTTLKRHAGLVDQMAGQLGLDLEEEVLRGNLRPDEVPDLVLSCTNCTNPDDCERWLAENDGAQATPSYCRNAKLFAQLSGG
jgi:hypothetical protein